MLLAVRHRGVHVHVSHVRIASDEIGQHRINGKLNDAGAFFEYPDIVFALAAEGVGDADTAVAVRGHFIFRQIVPFRISCRIALVHRINGDGMLRTGFKRRMAAERLDREADTGVGGEYLGKNVVV